MNNPPKFIIEDEVWAKELEEGFENYMSACWESVEEVGHEDFRTLSGEIFCGCQTCITREQLFYLVPKVIEGYKKGAVILEE